MAPELKTFYDRNLLERLLPLLVFMNFGQVRPMPAREGQTVNFRRFNSLSVATTPLTEGVTPGRGRASFPWSPSGASRSNRRRASFRPGRRRSP